MRELRGMHNLTPENFERLFAGFQFKFHPEVQPHDQFLRTKSGDCDDFATVAAEILGSKGYTPRMIAIRMKGETHVVCYIEEAGGYLDYNTRKDQNPLVPCSPEITAIATKVAAGFRRDWVATYEFTYDPQADVKHLVNNILPNPDIADMAKTAGTTADSRMGAKR
jgi:transglutaminase-like putative cysteine protease